LPTGFVVAESGGVSKRIGDGSDVAVGVVGRGRAVREGIDNHDDAVHDVVKIGGGLVGAVHGGGDPAGQVVAGGGAVVERVDGGDLAIEAVVDEGGGLAEGVGAGGLVAGGVVVGCGDSGDAGAVGVDDPVLPELGIVAEAG